MPKGRVKLKGPENRNLYFNPEKNYYTARIYDASRNGTVERTLTATTLEKARRERDQLLVELGKGTLTKKRKRTITPYVFEILEIMRHGKAKKTFLDFETHARLYLLPYFQHTPIEKIESRWELYKAHQKALNPNRGLKHDRKHMVRILRHANRSERIPTGIPDLPLDPADAITREPHVYTPEEINRLLATAGPKWTLIIRLAITEGLRVGEILQIRRQDLDLTASLLTLPGRHTKTRRARTVPINPDSANAIASVLKRHPHDFLFPNRANPKHPAMNYGRSWKRLCTRAKVTTGTFHDLRHTSVTWALRLGSPAAILQKNRGMSPQVMERVYTHAQHQTSREASEKILSLIQAGTWENLGKQQTNNETTSEKQKAKRTA